MCVRCSCKDIIEQQFEKSKVHSVEFSTKAAARRKPPCCRVWMSLQQLFLPQFLYAAGFVGIAVSFLHSGASRVLLVQVVPFVEYLRGAGTFLLVFSKGSVFSVLSGKRVSEFKPERHLCVTAFLCGPYKPLEKPKPVSICECLSSRAILYLIPKESFPGRKAFSKSCRNFRSAKGAPAMAQQLPHVIPSIYLANYLNDFEPLFPRYGVTPLGRKKRWKGSNIKKRP